MRLATSMILAFVCCVNLVRGDDVTQRDVDELRALVEENFAACNREDVKALLATHHPLTPQAELAELGREAEQCFRDTDVRVRLVSMMIKDFHDPRNPHRAQLAIRANRGVCDADAEIVQLTLPSDHSYADLEEYPAQLSTDFRHRSAMLPSSQLVKYTVRFWYDYKARKWKMLGIISKVEPVGQWPENIRGIMQGEPPFANCYSGICPSPLVNSGRR